MKLMHDLFSSDVGLMSAGVIGFIIVMAAYLFVFVRRKMREDAAALPRH